MISEVADVSIMRRHLVAAFACTVALAEPHAQTLIRSAREVLNAPRPLTSSEISQVLAASRQAMGSKSFRLSLAPERAGGFEVLMSPDGRLKMTRMSYGIEGGSVSVGGDGTATGTRWHEDFITIVDYTGRQARHCDGSIEPGEMVIEYVHRSSVDAWTATARRRAAPEPGAFAQSLDLLTGMTAFTSGDRKQIGDRPARALGTAWTRPPGTARGGFGIPEDNPVGATQWLWIDTESLLPLRSEVVFEGVSTFALSFVFEAIDVQPPAGVVAPDCIF